MTAEHLTPALSVEIFEEEHGDHNVRVVTTPGVDAIVYICHDCDARMSLRFVSPAG